MARTFQNIRLFKELSVLDNVKIGGHIHYKYSGTSAVLHTNRFHDAEEAAESEAMELLEIFGLEPRARLLREESSVRRSAPAGDRARARGAAEAAAARRAGRGSERRETLDLMETIHDIRDRFDIAILLIEHNMELVMGICERIIVLNFGKTIARERPKRSARIPWSSRPTSAKPAEAAGV